MKERYYADYGRVMDRQEQHRIVFDAAKGDHEGTDFREAVKLAELLNKGDD
jgi:hypothetical protein